jgi:hypothetical protein
VNPQGDRGDQGEFLAFLLISLIWEGIHREIGEIKENF